MRELDSRGFRPDGGIFGRSRGWGRDATLVFLSPLRFSFVRARLAPLRRCVAVL